MAELPLISVIVPVYKVEQYLDRCVESILTQTYTALDIILVDDGSPDNSGTMCDRWAEKDRRIRVIHQPNGGLSCARNTGIEHAQGHYLMFVDSDDVISPHLCEELYAAMGDGDVSVCDAVHIFPEKDWAFTRQGTVSVYDPLQAICLMWYQTAFLPSAWAKLFRRELFAQHRFTQGRLFEDIDLMHEVLYDAKKVVYTTAQLYGYVHREDSITTTAFSARDMDILLIADKLMTFSEDKPALQAAAKAYAVTAALRVYLNAPNEPTYAQGREKAVALIDTYGREVLRDPHIRKKNRYALWLYFYCKPALRMVYKYINRWK